jgi:hypothetical protein
MKPLLDKKTKKKRKTSNLIARHQHYLCSFTLESSTSFSSAFLSSKFRRRKEDINYPNPCDLHIPAFATEKTLNVVVINIHNYYFNYHFCDFSQGSKYVKK